MGERAAKRIRATVEGGNFVPSDLDPEGEAELAGGRLRLKGPFLGSRDGSPQSGRTYLFEIRPFSGGPVGRVVPLG